MPPMTSAAGPVLASRRLSYCSWTCMASSRVGTRIRARYLALRQPRCELLDHRNQERQRLAGAGLGRGKYVFTLQCGRNRGRLYRRRGSEMELCQLLLEPSRQGHIFKLCQTICSFLEGRLAKSAYKMRVAKILLKPLNCLFGAENETEAGKAGNRIKLRIGCRLQAAVANSVYLGLYHSAPKNVHQRSNLAVLTCRNRGNQNPAVGLLHRA